MIMIKKMFSNFQRYIKRFDYRDWLIPINVDNRLQSSIEMSLYVAIFAFTIWLSAQWNKVNNREIEVKYGVIDPILITKEGSYNYEPRYTIIKLVMPKSNVIQSEDTVNVDIKDNYERVETDIKDKEKYLHNSFVFSRYDSLRNHFYSETSKVKDFDRNRPLFYSIVKEKEIYPKWVSFFLGVSSRTKVGPIGLMECFREEDNDRYTLNFVSYIHGTSSVEHAIKISATEEFGSIDAVGPTGILSLEDISQSYYSIKVSNINMLASDTLSLIIDFVGATDFSKMQPQPDEITMSEIKFNDPNKIWRIKADGLQFHVNFKEFEVKQAARMAALGAVQAALIAIFVVFLVLRLLKKINKRKESGRQLIRIEE